MGVPSQQVMIGIDPGTSRTSPEHFKELGRRQDVFSLNEGPVTIQWPASLSPESFEDVSAWLDILKRKIGREVRFNVEQPQRRRLTCVRMRGSMSEQIQLLDVVVEPLPLKPVPPRVIYLVAAYRVTSNGGYWKIFRKRSSDDHPTLKKAEEISRELGPSWVRPCVLRVFLPGA